jgi:hypothetical protein
MKIPFCLRCFLRQVAVVQPGARIGFIEKSGVDRVFVWSIYEVTGGKTGALPLARGRRN